MKTNPIRLSPSAIAASGWVLPFLCLGLAVVLVTGCDPHQPEDREVTEEDLRDEAAEAVDAVADYTQRAAADLRSELEDQAEQLNDRINTLQEEAREGSEALVEQSRDQLDRVKNAIDRLESVTVEQWAQVRQETGELISNLEAWWEDIGNE